LTKAVLLHSAYTHTHTHTHIINRAERLKRSKYAEAAEALGIICAIYCHDSGGDHRSSSRFRGGQSRQNAELGLQAAPDPHDPAGRRTSTIVGKAQMFRQAVARKESLTD
jgi:hypothetical protein